jgi:hypothetical protein
MPFTQTTALGRRVPIDDWLGFHRDRLLGVLYQMRDAGGDHNGLTLQQVSDITGLKLKDALELVQRMKPRFLCASKTNMPVTVMLTKRGVRWVEERPATRAGH